MGAFDEFVAAPAANAPPPQRGAFDDFVAPHVLVPQASEHHGVLEDVTNPNEWRQHPLQTYAETVLAPILGPANALEYLSRQGGRVGAFAGNFQDSLSLGFGDELQGVQAGFDSAIRGGDYSRAFRERVNEARARLEAARQEHPVTSLAGGLAGGAAIPVVGPVSRAIPLGRALTETAAGGRTLLGSLGAVGSQAALSAGAGSLFGGIYGAGEANDGDRFEGAKQGALWGGALGAVTPLAFQGVAHDNALWRGAAGATIGSGAALMTGQDPLQGAAWGAGLGFAGRPLLAQAGPVLASLRDAWRNPHEAFGNQVGMSLGIPPMGGHGPSAPAINVPRSVVQDVDRLIGLQRYGVDELGNRIEAAHSEPLGRTLADVGGEQFLSKADMLAQSPGQTGPRAAALAEARARDLPTQIESDFQNRLGVNLSPTQASRIIDEGLSLNGTGYEGVTAQTPRAGVVTQRINPMMRDPAFQEALARLDRGQTRRAMLADIDGVEPPPQDVVRGPDGQYRLAENTGGDTLHRLKMAFDDAIGAGQRRNDPSSIEKFESLDVSKGPNSLRERLLGALNDALPGYSQVRNTHGGLYEAQQALEQGGLLLNKRPAEVGQIMADASPFERQHMRIALLDKIFGKVMRSSSNAEGRMKNAAEPVINNEVQNTIRAAFDDSQEADNLIRTLNERDRLFRNARTWVTGSQTFRRGAQAGDSLLSAITHAASGNPGGAATQGLREGLNALQGHLYETRNNALGDALLRNVEGQNPEDEAYLRALLAQLRKREAARTRRAQSAAYEGATGAVGGGSYTDNNQGP